MGSVRWLEVCFQEVNIGQSTFSSSLLSPCNINYHSKHKALEFRRQEIWLRVLFRGGYAGVEISDNVGVLWIEKVEFRNPRIAEMFFGRLT